jgi:hypothetical protein
MKALALCFILLTAPAHAQCRMALVFAQDVSQSVDDTEYVLQAEGVATALTSPEIADLMLLMEGPVALAAFEWSGQSQIALIQTWTLIENRESLNSFANAIRNHQRGFQFGPTAIGTALDVSHSLIQSAPLCARRVIDISGDGLLNDGPTVQDVYERLNFDGITVNALVVGGTTSPEITLFYENDVVRGTGAFVEVAQDFDDYERAMIRKLRRELALPLSEAQ